MVARGLVGAAALLLVGCTTGSTAGGPSSQSPSGPASPTASTPTTGAAAPSASVPAPGGGSGAGVVLTYDEVFSGGQSPPPPDRLVVTLLGSYGKFERGGAFESLVNAKGFYICVGDASHSCRLFPGPPVGGDQTRQTLQYRRPLDFLRQQVVAGKTKASTRTVAGRAGRCLSGRDQITGETDLACADVATGYLIYLDMPDLLGSLTLVSLQTHQQIGPLVLPPGYQLESS
jgi:hypothetical protein